MSNRTVIYPARIVRTLDPARPVARAIAVRDGLIRAVGTVEELGAYPNTVIDERYADMVIVPGFVEAHAHAVPDAAAALTRVQGTTTLDPFDDVLSHLATVHPSRYVKLVDGLAAIGLTGVHPFANQTDALRFVAFVDRLYDAQVQIAAEGTPLDQVFPEEMLAGGYRKKYLRAASRLIALTNEG